MTDGLRKSHLRKAPQVGLSEVGLPEGNHFLHRYNLWYMWQIRGLVSSPSPIVVCIVRLVWARNELSVKLSLFCSRLCDTWALCKILMCQIILCCWIETKIITLCQILSWLVRLCKILMCQIILWIAKTKTKIIMVSDIIVSDQIVQDLTWEIMFYPLRPYCVRNGWIRS